PLLMQLAALGGVFLLSAVLLTINVLVALALDAASRSRKEACFFALVLAALLMISLAYGNYGYRRWRSSFPVPLKISMFQPGTNDFPQTFPIDVTAEFSRVKESLSAADPDLVVIPGKLFSKAISLADVAPPLLKSIFGSLMDRTDRIIVANFSLKEQDGTYTSSLVAFRNAKVIGVYRKEVLMPVSDYRPSGLVGQVFSPEVYGRFSPWHGENGLFLPEFRIGGLICNEVFVARLAQKRSDEGSRLIIVSTNDAELSSSLVLVETLRMTRLRAVESRQWILRAAKTGISAVINPAGEVVASLPENKEGVIIFPDLQDR
ncbi:hypothetical protein HYT04_02335, partial [Candidatus Kaiserbacteria bacterium]|nr:hypothetical protein [Candidatus Kaiserbacteria bacterium]